MKRYALIALCAAAASCSPSPAPEASRPEQSADAETAPASGAGEACPSLVSIREARPVSDTRIDFITSGGTVYRNDLPGRCSGLMSNRAFTYETSMTQLCQADIIRIVEQTGGYHLGASCALGRFTQTDAAGE